MKIVEPKQISRIGRLELDLELFVLTTPPQEEILKTLFSIFFPVHIQREPYKQRATYVGICERFDPILEGQKIPLYRAIITTHLIGGELNLGQTYSIKMEKTEEEHQDYKFYA